MTEITNVNNLSPGDEITVSRGETEIFSGVVQTVGTSAGTGRDYADVEISPGEYRSVTNNAGHRGHRLVSKGISYKGSVTVLRG